MDKALGFKQYSLYFGIPLGLLGILILLMRSPALLTSNSMALAITADLLLTVPMVYFLLIRKSKIPKTTVVPIMLLGLLVGYSFLPAEHQDYLDLFKTWGLPLIELAVVTYVVIHVRKAVQTYKKLKNTTPDFYDTLKDVCGKMLPSKLAAAVATEIAVFYYGFVAWKKREVRKNEFTYHKKSGSLSILGGILLIIVVETIAVHFLLAKWSVVAAWIFTGLSLYTALQLFGFARALGKRPIILGPETLQLRYGILNETTLALNNIESIEVSSRELDFGKEVRKLSFLGDLEGHNIIIHLKNENTITGLYGISRKYKVLGLHLDAPAEFKEKVDRALCSNKSNKL
ncbi:hypothetical protein [Robiginitalea sp. IMCC43444]|uniref:hypothetical protein n=1 Tax=Robiginitalea sp. IMCC43444 TaxID=3459121 RepID=UPI004042A410